MPIWIYLLCFEFVVNGAVDPVPACSSEIYCHGSLLDTVQNAGLFEDSKTFVDMSLTESPAIILAEFRSLQQKYVDGIPEVELRKFVDQYFKEPGQEMEHWEPDDLPRIPSFLSHVKDPLLYDFGWDLCSIWKDFGRKIKLDVLDNPDRYSLLHLPNPFIVPGGRFRETYYWDTYWVMKGLLVCQMNKTAKGMLDNFVHLIDTYGHIPNGARNYFIKRSQPPLFIPMVYDYFQITDDLNFVRENIASMEREYLFWLNNRSVSITRDGEVYSLGRYAVDVTSPRPESYSEDVTTTAGMTPDEKQRLYSHLTSACESGWDFSSRWFSGHEMNDSDVETNSRQLRQTETKNIIPVDLNSILCRNEKILADFYNLIGDNIKADEYTRKHRERRKAINTLLWSEDSGMWFDYSLVNNQSRRSFFPSNIFPLFFDCDEEDSLKREHQIDRVRDYIENTNVDYIGGIPTSLDNSGQQWDFPNVWPPLEHAWIVGLNNTGDKHLGDMVLEQAEKWIQSNYKGWQRTRTMFEKYSATEPGKRGSGGEYNVQEGFGWTNGVALDLLSRFGEILTHSRLNDDHYLISLEACPTSPQTSSAASNVRYGLLPSCFIFLKFMFSVLNLVSI